METFAITLCWLCLAVWQIGLWRKDYTVRTRLFWGVVSLYVTVSCLFLLLQSCGSVGGFNLENKKIENLFFYSLTSIAVTGTFLIGALLKKHRNPEQKILPTMEYGRVFSALAVITLTGSVALLPVWLYRIASQGEAVIGGETLDRLVFGRPYIFWSFQLVLLLSWLMFIKFFCFPELTAGKRIRQEFNSTNN